MEDLIQEFEEPIIESDGQNEGSLERLLKRANARVNASEAREIVAGVASCPHVLESQDWVRLICSNPDHDLRTALSGLVSETRDRLADDDFDPQVRLESLRSLLKRRRLAGFIVPRSDEHQSEYVASRSERLAWLTGFTGSAGTALVLSKAAAIFVDGRYTVQARGQVASSLYEVCHSTDEPLTQWIASHLPSKGRLGYDPWLHTPAQVNRLKAACKKAGGRLVAVSDNPIDALWFNQPSPPIAPVVKHDQAFAGESSAEKRERLAESLRKGRLDATIVASPDSICWLLNIRGGDVPYAPIVLAFAIVHADASVQLFVNTLKLDPGLRRWMGDRVSICSPDGLGAALDTLGSLKKCVKLDPDKTPDWIARRLNKAGAEIVFEQDPCALPKATKNKVELAGIRAAHCRDGAALTRFLAWLSRNVPSGELTEIDAAIRLQTFRSGAEHYRGPSFPTISAAGSNGAIVHYQATAGSNRVLESGTLYLVDSGGQYLDGTTDVTRTVAIGVPSHEMKCRFTLVLKGHIAIATARFPKGTTGPQLDTLARQSLWSSGLDYDHGTGHGVGHYLGVHEGPQRISKLANGIALEPGMVVSNEPGYYQANGYGIRIESLVAVVQTDPPPGAEKELYGFDTLTLAPIDLNLVDPTMLTDMEISWLNRYHDRVRETLTPLLDKETAAWLGGATHPIVR